MINRDLEGLIRKQIDYEKAIIVLGPRQVGKTTLLEKIAHELNSDYLYINGDDPATRLTWSNPSQAFILQYLGDHKVVLIDEAQRLENIGLSMKMIVDAKKKIQLLVSGSSALEIANKINEPLTGRKWEHHLFPLSWNELTSHYSLARTLPRLKEFLVTGLYPEVVTHPANAKELLANIAGSYLYKDILENVGIRRPEILLRLLRALAWQVGNEVSYNELAQTIEADKTTVSTYIDLLEKAFVIFRLSPFARNLRNEIRSSRKIYFYDNGIRNSIINNYAPLEERNDIGALWENFIISERIKKLSYAKFYGNAYFWRNMQQAEIDYVEETDGKMWAYEIKWNPNVKVKFPKAFVTTYEPEETKIIHQNNFWEWLS